MSRLTTNGFELNSLTTKMEVDSTTTSGGATLTISSTTFRSGLYALRAANSGASGTAFIVHGFNNGSNSTGPNWMRSYIYIAALPAAITDIIVFATVSGTAEARIRLATDGTLELWDNTAKIGSSSAALSLNTWYRIELYFENISAAFSITGRLDGVSFASTAAATSANIGTARIGVITATSSFDIFFDDIAINSSSGSFQNTWPGAGSIIHLHPNAAGDNNAWTRGGTDSGANWSQESEVTPDDVGTYVTSNTLNQIDDYNIDDPPAAIGASDTISVVGVNLRMLGVSAGANVVPRCKASSGGTVEEGNSLSPSGVAWATNRADASNTLGGGLVMYDLPGASTTVWTKADLTTSQIGVKVSLTSTNARQVSTVWMVVEYIPSVVVPPAMSFSNATFNITFSGNLAFNSK